jgi:hypothetical protein
MHPCITDDDGEEFRRGMGGGNYATVTEAKHGCQEISIGLKKRKMECLTFQFRFIRMNVN